MNGPLDVLREFQAFGLLAFVITVFATPLAAALARRWGVMDVPDSKLKPHATPTPYLGGAAIGLGWCAAIILAINYAENVQLNVLLPIMLGGLGMTTLGLIDDIREIPPKLRLSLGAAIILTVLLFVQWNTLHGLQLPRVFLALLGLNMPAMIAVPVSFVFSLFVVLGACNSTNLIDGLDGLCAGVTAIISLGFFIIAGHIALGDMNRDLNETRLVLAIAMFGAALGFLPFNFNPAKIFMGDAGSVLLGYNCGILIVLFDERGVTRWMLASLVVFALPICDTALAIIRRWRNGKSIFTGDRSHFYDQLVDRGMSVRKVVAISYALSAFFGALGCMSIFLRLRYAVVVYAIVAIATVIVIIKAGMVRVESKPQGS